MYYEPATLYSSFSGTAALGGCSTKMTSTATLTYSKKKELNTNAHVAR